MMKILKYLAHPFFLSGFHANPNLYEIPICLGEILSLLLIVDVEWNLRLKELVKVSWNDKK